MIGRCGEAAKERHSPSGIERGGENHLLKEIDRHVPGARKREHQAARFEKTQRIKIDVFVAARRAIDFHPPLGEGRRIAHDKTESLVRCRQLADVSECIRYCKSYYI